MEPTRQLSIVLDRLCGLVDSMWHQQLAAPTVTGVTVHELLDRMMIVAATHTYWLRGDGAPALDPPVTYGWVPAAEYREVMDDLCAAVMAPGATDQVVVTSGGEVHGGDLVRQLLVGALLHGWELAAAIGRRFDVPADVLVDIDPFAAVPAA